jgi:polyferredoxin/ferredoxin
MRISTTRRISQVFFFLLFLWFCATTTLGHEWWQLRGWPVNWIIQLDPLTGLGTLLTTHTIYDGLLWGLLTVVLTIVFGRFFCGWLCPFGTVQQAVGYIAHRNRSISEKAAGNRYQKAQAVKYWILIFLMTAAAADTLALAVRLPADRQTVFLILIAVGLAVIALSALGKVVSGTGKIGVCFALSVALWLFLSRTVTGGGLFTASLQIGLLDPIPLFYRSINLVFLPLVGGTFTELSAYQRFYEGAWSIGLVCLTLIFLCLRYPRFYCRTMCPLGALFGILSRFAVWRIGKHGESCRDCRICESFCEGACEPSARIRSSECVLCMNCLNGCRHGVIGYRTEPSATGETLLPDITRRELIVSVLSGVCAIPMARLGGELGANWRPDLIRPPGALSERDFLRRCVKCGQCMRVCPTNVIQPALFEAGIEGLWTPVLNFRIGTSGCQLNCIACGNICPTAAIRPIRLDEKLGVKAYAAQGPIRIGIAFVDRGRCLPWAMDRPCIVCQENCPVSPKAIFIREAYMTVKGYEALRISRYDSNQIQIEGARLSPDLFSTGDYFCSIRGQRAVRPRRIMQHTERILMLSSDADWESLPVEVTHVDIQIRLQRPFVDPKKCTGCGICEHECPVQGKRAIRVTADNESRHRRHRLLL